MNEMNLLGYRKKDKNLKNLYFAKSHSSSKKSRKCNILNTDLKINKKKFFKNIYQRNILFKNKISLKNANSTSTSSLSSSTEKKYLTPTKNEPNSNIGNDYYINENINNKKNLFQNINISRPKLNFNYKYKKNKNLHLALGTGINRYNNIYFSGNDYGNNKELVINRSFKFHNIWSSPKLFAKINKMHLNNEFEFTICDEELNIFQYIYDKNYMNKIYYINDFQAEKRTKNKPTKLISLGKRVIILCNNSYYIFSY